MSCCASRSALAALLIALSGVAGVTGAAAPMSDDATRLLQWVKHTHDHGGAPFIIIDKRQALLWVLDGAGEPLAVTPVLLGAAHGDRSVPGIGAREISRILPHERTTPAGRFVAEPGRNLKGEDIFWIDYDAAVSMHRVRATNPAERRLQRLASPTIADNRISYGCINVPAAFYDARIRPLWHGHRGVVYLLPDTLALQQVFTAISDVDGASARRPSLAVRVPACKPEPLSGLAACGSKPPLRPQPSPARGRGSSSTPSPLGERVEVRGFAAQLGR